MLRNYPEVIDDRVLAANAHVSAAKVEQDILDTEAEIGPEEERAAGFEALAKNPMTPDSESRIHQYHADGLRIRNEERHKFIAFLRRLQAARAAAVMV